jgi:hypothetical protein
MSIIINGDTGISGVANLSINGNSNLGDTASDTVTINGAIGLAGANFGTLGQVLTSGGAGAAPTWSAIAASGIGVGQTWQNVSGSRALNTTYTNSTGKPIMFSVSAIASSVPPSTGYSFSTVVGGVSIFAVSGVTTHIAATNVSGSTGLSQAGQPVIVPTGATYSFNMSLGASVTWWELR